MGSKEQMERVLELVSRGIGPAPDGKYRHWDTVRRISSPGEVEPELYWMALKLARSQSRREVKSLMDRSGLRFHYTLPDPLLSMLHEIDKSASGELATIDPVSNAGIRNRYIQRSLIEEAITSSQLEGAATTRRVAKEMIRSGRRPATRSERMILNNYKALESIKDLIGVPLSRELIENIHSSLTKDLLESPDEIYRKHGDGIAVFDNQDNKLLHLPPDANEIPERLQRLCDFANTSGESFFLHPAVKAIIIHFWLAYDHPFVDGNGRTARALFYWYMLREGFWLMEFVSISRILKNAPAKYGMSFLYTETDQNDLTYFLLAQLKVILRAIDDLNHYLSEKTTEIRRTEALLQPGTSLNSRQTSLVSHALRNPDAQYTIESHKNSHGVTYQTARTDLLDLETKGLLDKERSGNKFIFRAPANLADKIAELN